MTRKERRRLARTYSNVPLDLYDSEGRVIIGEGRFHNISLTGSLMESRQSLHRDQRLRLLMQTPGKSSLEVAGRVMWRKKRATSFHYGIRFEPLRRSRKSSSELALSA